MYKYRIKISAVLNDFKEELRKLENYDNNNQKRFSSIPSTLTSHQLNLLTESIFFRAFRAYENFVREIFLLYCNEKQPNKRKKVRSYLKPRNFKHTEELMKSSMNFLDWNQPDNVIKRADLYLKDGFPVKLPYTTNRNELLNLKRIRNHIAHNSQESLDKYKIVLRSHFGVNPLNIPSPGEFLLLTHRTNQNMYNLQYYFGILNNISDDLT